jgi:hypothetical protein
MTDRPTFRDEFGDLFCLRCAGLVEHSRRPVHYCTCQTTQEPTR